MILPAPSFLLHARQQAEDRAVDPIPGAHPAGVPRLPPLADSTGDDGAVGASAVTATRKRKVRGSRQASDEATATAASAAAVLTVSLSLEVTADDATATAAPAADTVPGFGTNPAYTGEVPPAPDGAMAAAAGDDVAVDPAHGGVTTVRAATTAASTAAVLAVSLSPDETDGDRGASGCADAIPAAAAPVTQRQPRKRKYSPAHAEQRQRRRGGRRKGDGSQAGGGGGSRVRTY